MPIGQLVLVVCCGALGAGAGSLVPRWVARLPEPATRIGVDAPDQASAALTATGAEPESGGLDAKTPYAELARWRLLPLLAGLVLAPTWALLAWRTGLDPVLPALLYLAAVGVVLAYVDLRVRLLPNALVLPSYVIVAALLTLAAAVSGQWANLGWAFLGGAALWAFLAFLGLVSPSGMGFGDVKLGGVLGLGLGWFGLPHVLIGVAYAFVLGGLVSLALIIGGRATRRSAIAFGPFLVVGFLLAVLTGDELVGWYLGR